jgi:hypothetical protein
MHSCRNSSSTFALLFVLKVVTPVEKSVLEMKYAFNFLTTIYIVQNIFASINI